MDGSNAAPGRPSAGGAGASLADALIAASRDAIVAADASGAITLWNPAAADLFGRAAEDVLGRSLDVIIPEPMRGEHAAGMRRIGGGGAPRLIGKPVEVMARRADGSLFPIEMRIGMWRDAAGEHAFGAIIRDVSERRRNEERLHGLAHFDQLTMLPNRLLFLQRLSEALSADREVQPLCVIVADLDKFADLNDRFGHAAGDGLLHRVATLLKRLALESGYPGATAARIGPNQFAILLPGCADPLAASGVANAVIETVRSLGEADALPVTASAGVAIAPDHGSTSARILANADFALRRAKQDGGDRRQTFQHNQREAHRIRRDLETELKRAWKRGEFEVHFQPQIRLGDRMVAGAEALLRWRHPERGLVLPGAFLSVLKDHALSEPVGDFVLETACRQAAAWRAALGRPFRIGVNLFERQFVRCDQKQRVEAALAASGLPPEDLELELIETIVTGSDDASVRRVRRLREIGVGVAFDDYGTGYASLALLKRYPITRLKIDRSFVRDVAGESDDRAIVELILTLGRQLGLGVIAEGVETAAQAARLHALGCVEAQGYLFGRPMPAEDFGALLGLAPGRAAARVA